MNLYAELLENNPVGSTVRVDSIENRFVASTTFKEGKLGVIESIQGKVAFIRLVKDNKPSMAVTSGSALGVTIAIPVKASASLSITIEE